MENRVINSPTAPESIFGYFNQKTKRFEPKELKTHLIELGLFIESRKHDNITISEDLKAYYNNLQKLVDNL